jgi:hypothetical protein
MKYALISTDATTVWMWVPNNDDDQTQTFTEVSVPAGTIINLLEYDGLEPYTPESGLELAEVPDDAKIGDSGF